MTTTVSAGDMQTILNMLPLVIPLAILELGLMIWAIVNIATRKAVRFNNKALWIIIVVLVSVIGPIVYFAFGRVEEVRDDSDND
jgi:hypothetical protein